MLRRHRLTIANQYIRPSLIQGDRELGGKVDIHVWAQLEVRRDAELWVRFGMHVREPRGDFSTAEGRSETRVFAVRPGDRILKILSDASSEHWFRDETWEDDVIREPSQELVRIYNVKGDRAGADIDWHTSCTFMFNPVELELEVR